MKTVAPQRFLTPAFIYIALQLTFLNSKRCNGEAGRFQFPFEFRPGIKFIQRDRTEWISILG